MNSLKSPFLIGVGGQFGSGKDLLCNYLAGRLNADGEDSPHFHRTSFASNVKRIYCEAFGVDLEFIEKWKRVDEPPPGMDMNVRKGLTFIGDGFRQIQGNIWIDMLLRGNKKNLIISDVRYINECKAVRENGIAILMWRPGHENNFQNRSEQELMPYVRMLQNAPDGAIEDPNIPFDLWIKNDGDIDSLYKKIDDLVIPHVDKV